ncbi:hypothetical protein AwPolaro_00490 [Polaromonas sp.]|nr:hypothetical protein AwPolaro_00490 [Polaromonas sp.]
MTTSHPSKHPPKTTRRWLKIAAFTSGSLVTLAVAGTGALWWWAGTDSSLATVLHYAGNYQPLTTQGVSGSLRRGGHIEQLQWQQNGLSVKAGDVRLAWQPWALLQGRLQLDHLSAASVQVNDQRASDSTSAPAEPPQALGLPLQITLNEFSLAQFDLSGHTAFSASNIAGHYRYSDAQHQLNLSSAEVASGHYSAQATLTANAPLTLDASVNGALTVTGPDHPEPVALTFQASAKGLLVDLQVKAELQMSAALATAPKQPALQPQASLSARVTPWAAQPLPQAEATFRDLDLAALLPQVPQTQLTGSVNLQPLQDGPDAAPAWGLQLKLANALPGPWDQQRLPLEQLDAEGEWQEGMAMIRSLKAQLGGGELLASGNWAPAAAEPPAQSQTQPEIAWHILTTLKHINPALLHSKLAPLPLDGHADIKAQGEVTRFDVHLQAAIQAQTKTKALLQQAQQQLLRLQSASASGSWNATQAGGTLTLSALQLRSDDAQLSGQLEVQPFTQGAQGKLIFSVPGLIAQFSGAQGKLTFSAPGLSAQFSGELQKTKGSGRLSLEASHAEQALRWLQKLPGMPATLAQASASGSATLQANWQGGWLNPTLQAQLAAPSLDWQAGSPLPAPTSTPKVATSKQAKPAASDESPTTPSPPEPEPLSPPSRLKIRALQANLTGRLSQAELSVKGQAELDQRRYTLELSAAGGQPKSAASAQAQAPWQGLLKQLSLSVEDPALGAGAWQIATHAPVSFKWTANATGGAFESGAGELLLTAPARQIPAAPPPSSTTAAAPSQATLSWQPVRWRPGNLLSAGTIRGLPLAWAELLAGPQLAGTGLGGSLVFDGQWDAAIGSNLKLNASLSRSSGDITLQAEGTQGRSTQVAAGIKQAHISIETTGDALTLALLWDSEHAGQAKGELTTPLSRNPNGQGWHWAANAPLKGHLNAQLPRISVWSLLAPPGWRLRGSLGADVAISGNRAAPLLLGDLQANNLALRSVIDGIEFGQGRLRAKLNGTHMLINEFSLQGAGENGGGGSLMAQGEVDWLGGKPQVQLTTKLQQLRVSIRSDRQITVSGDVQASLKDAKTSLTGQLVMDRAIIVLPDEGTPQLGNDVLVRTASGGAAGQKGPEKTSANSSNADQSSQALTLAVKIDLGPDFRIQGKGIDTRIRGTLALSAATLGNPQLSGVVRTSGGQYRAYGQRLDVEKGVIRFTGAMDNPALDILAIRPNLTQRVGVQITGTALLPSVRLYAQPELPDAEKLSWLVVGRPSASGGAESALLQQAALALLGSKGGGSGGLAASLGLDELSFSGAASDGTATGGAVTLGKRFSRDLYAAYERSLSGAMGTLYVFYDLSKRFTVRAQAGEQSAVDLIFTVPYD